MTAVVQNILQSFDELPEIERREVASEIIRRSLGFSLPPLSDEELVSNADALFLELDQRESENGKSIAR